MEEMIAKEHKMIIEGDYNEDTGFGEVRINGQRLDPDESKRVWNHSPDGFAWGYGGSGPSQLALAILLAAKVGQTTAIMLHHRFKSEFLAPLPKASFCIEVNVLEWTQATIKTTAIPTTMLED